MRVAVFVLGLNESSRLKRAINESMYKFDTLILAGIFDRLNLLFWSKTNDAKKGMNKPKQLVEVMSGKVADDFGFESGEVFENEREKIIKKLQQGGD